MDRNERKREREREEKGRRRHDKSVLQQPRGEVTSSDVALIRSIRPPRSRELVRAVARARINAPRHGRVARKRSLCAIAIVFASLFHYDGVWRVPYPIRPDCQRLLPSSLPRAHILPSLLRILSFLLLQTYSLFFSSFFRFSLSSFPSFHVPLPRSPLSFLRFPRRDRERERERHVSVHRDAHVSFLLVRRECLRWSLDSRLEHAYTSP